MAGRRVAKSAIEWAAFAERVPPAQKDAFRAFKAKSDFIVSKVHAKPEALPKIDWAFYRSRLATPTMVDEFQKAYESLTVPYPKDPENLKAKVDVEEKEAAEVSKKFVAECQNLIKDAQGLLAKMDSLPPLDQMTHEMYLDYFPDQARRADKPSFWPHTKIHQPGSDPNEVK